MDVPPLRVSRGDNANVSVQNLVSRMIQLDFPRLYLSTGGICEERSLRYECLEVRLLRRRQKAGEKHVQLFRCVYPWIDIVARNYPTLTFLREKSRA